MSGLHNHLDGDFKTMMSCSTWATEASAFASLITDHITWPLVVLLLAFCFRRLLQELIPRLTSLKHGDTELTFAEASKLAMSDTATDKEKAQIKRRQIISTGGDFDGGSGYRLFSNGIFVQKLRVARSHQEICYFVFPITFPNEVTSVQVLGDVHARVVSVTASGCEIAFSAGSKSDRVLIIASGL